MLRSLLLCLFFAGVTALVAQVNFSESTLPVVVINTNGQTIPNEPKITANLGIVWNGPGQKNRPNDPFNAYNGKIGIERRGASSQDLFPKVSYSIELRDNSGADNPVALLGMPKESDWTLITNYNDKSLIRDALAYNLAGRVMGYAPRCRFVEVVLNGDYLGVYLLTERIKRDPGRVNISKNEPGGDVTGGYILKLDKEIGDSISGSWVSHIPPLYANWGQTIRFLYHYPRTEDLTPAQTQYIQQWMYNFEENLRSPNFAHPVNGYRKYIDPATFIDFMWLNEAFKNIDGYRISTFFYKDRDDKDGRLKMGPVWDFNLAFGNCNYCNGEFTSGWMWNFNAICPQDYWVIPFWWDRLRQDTGFLIEAQQRWKALRAGPLSDQAAMAAVDSLVAVLDGGPRTRNFQRWPVLGVWIWPNNFVGNTYSEEVDYLKNWFLERLKWMDANVTGLYVGTYNPDGFFPPRVAPNPARGTTRLEFYAPVGVRVSWALYDISGKALYRYYDSTKTPNYHVIEIDLPSAPGLYFLQTEVEGKRYVQKVVVE